MFAGSYFPPILAADAGELPHLVGMLSNFGMGMMRR